MELIVGLALLLGCFVATAAATGLVLRWLRARAILDRPNARSSHDAPTPRGGGIAVMAVLLPALAGTQAWLGVPWPIVTALFGAALLLAAVSWADDRRPLGALPRLLAQAIAVLAGLWATGPNVLAYWLGLPVWFAVPAVALAWIWFINLYNFMDGIDGITGVETGGIGAGLAAIGIAAPIVGGALYSGLVLAGVAAGFLVWNWHRARVFLGDVGSVPLGFVVGALLLSLAVAGQWAAALILPLYYLADATLTLARRVARGAKPWRAHREHFYQRAVQGGLAHDRVATIILAGNVGLVGAAVLATRPGSAWPALALAAALVAAELAYFATRRRRLAPGPAP
jgi:UDP-N-acetylmuramyl pentapeptide phosphotransferase/UDP-N-acetylglucosamine-1-phosphate transferase